MLVRHPWLAPALAIALSAPLTAEVTQKRVEIRAPDGVRLVATSFSSERPGPAILLLHMCNSERSAWNGLGAKLAARGFHALALDYRGYGESGGERSPDPAAQQKIIDEKWPGDADAAWAYLISQPGVAREPAGVAGGSCGVNQAIQFARRHPEVRTLVLLAGNANRAGEEFLDANGWLPLLGTAADDDVDAVPAMRWLLGFSTNPANRFLEYPTGGHGTQMFAAHADLEPAIVDWFDEHLVRQPPQRNVATEPGASPSARLRAQLLAPGAAERLRAQIAAAKSPAERPELPPEAIVNLIGYGALQTGDARGAIAIFRLNAEAHPESANVHDSLADAYVVAGDSDQARAESEKALAALPRDPARDSALEQAIREASAARLRQLEPPR
jgi:dienelactone hydrolase